MDHFLEGWTRCSKEQSRKDGEREMGSKPSLQVRRSRIPTKFLVVGLRLFEDEAMGVWAGRMKRE